MSTARPRVVLGTSGLGPSFGGIGVVSASMASIFRRDARLSIWWHPCRWPRALRVPVMLAQAATGALRRPDFVMWEHVDLAQLHRAIPRLRGVPNAIFLHGVEVWSPIVGRRRDAIERADLLLANSAFTVATARAANPWLPPVKVTWLGVEPPLSAGATRPEPVALIVGRISSIERRKGHDPVLDAWPAIRAAVPDARLLIAGTGDDVPRLRARVADEHLEGVELLGYVSDAERDRLYRRCRLYLFPSRQEGFGLAAVEAAAAATPVLGLRGTVLEELFPPGHGLVLADAPTGESIAAAAIPVLSDASHAASLGTAARARVLDVFRSEHFAERLRAEVARFGITKRECG